VQVLQAANTGITSLQSLIANAQSIANQVLQTSTGYTTKSNVTSAAITGATAANLLGTPPIGSVTARRLAVGRYRLDRRSNDLATAVSGEYDRRSTATTITFNLRRGSTSTSANGGTIGITAPATDADVLTIDSDHRHTSSLITGGKRLR
jgi:flagellin